jgi:hypothetical protein
MRNIEMSLFLLILNLRIEGMIRNTVVAQSLVQIHRKASGEFNIQKLQHFLYGKNIFYLSEQHY